MKREGRPASELRTLNGLRSPPTAGIFAKVSANPTNHSKFTSECGHPMPRQCHIKLASKFKGKVKGAQKVRLSPAWKMVDAEPNLRFSGFSVSSALDFLADYNYYEGSCIDYTDIEEVDEYHCGD